MYRIVTSEELVSPQDSAKEMIAIVKNREFEKIFQKSYRKVSDMLMSYNAFPLCLPHLNSSLKTIVFYDGF